MTPAELRARAEEIKAEWVAKAAAGDAKAKRLLRECYPEETRDVDAAAEVLAKPPPRPWSEPGEEG